MIQSFLNPQSAFRNRLNPQLEGMIGYTEEIKGILSLPLYDAQTCRAIIGEAKRAGSWTDAKVSERVAGGFNPAIRPEARSASVLALAAESEIRRTFDEKMEQIVKPLVNRVWHADLRQHSGTHFVRYVSGNYYMPHSDTGLNRNDRYFTVVCYLNEDFEGGETSFPQLNYRVAPRPGKTVIFPSTYMHCAEPIASGEKYILVSWLTGPAPIQWI
jgi:predicted 2-oxoglutarate/Fe(II)-dependent dioxygenase YbiX